MQLSDGVWPDRLPAVEVRIARPTDKLAEVLDFYCGHLGLPELYGTAAHGYQVVMLGRVGQPVVARERSYCVRRPRQLANRADAQPDSAGGVVR